MYSQVTIILLETGLFKKKKTKKTKTKQNKKKKKKEKKSKLHKVWAIPIPISTTKDVICCTNGYIYHFLDYIRLLLFMPMSFIMSKNVQHSSERKYQGSSSWRDLQISHICNFHSFH